MVTGVTFAACSRIFLSTTAACPDWNTRGFSGSTDAAEVRACLDAGADPDARDDDGTTPLHSVAWDAKASTLVEMLIDAGADPNAKDQSGRTPLHFAAPYNVPSVVALLLEAGGEVGARDDYGYTPLHRLAKRSNEPGVLATVDLLHKAGADPNTRETMYGSTPLHDAASRHTRLVEMAHNPDEKTLAEDQAKSVAFLLALVRALLDIGADPHALDDAGNTPLHKAAPNSDDPAVIAALLEAGADPHALNNKDNRPLHGAARWCRNPAVVGALLDGGANPMTLDGKGNTPYELALKNENLTGTRELERLKAASE